MINIKIVKFCCQCCDSQNGCTSRWFNSLRSSIRIIVNLRWPTPLKRVQVVLQSENRTRLVSPFLNKLKIRKRRGECVWTHLVNFLTSWLQSVGPHSTRQNKVDYFRCTYSCLTTWMGLKSYFNSPLALNPYSLFYLKIENKVKIILLD